MTNPEPVEPRVSGLAAGWTVQPESAPAPPTVAPKNDESEVEPGTETERVSNVVLMLLGVFGGLYLLYTWGWLEIAKAYSSINQAAASGSGIVGSFLQQFIFWLAPFAPLVWFVTSLKLTKKAGHLALAVALILGVVILVPLPMLYGGGGQ
ncbi:hypothetical protein JSO19_10875 [Leucobacter sp. UCMA 4100]|uniref:hypothetical protein n=1 Tax=Leucobacter sp. UCMA 4100 TaxID=2810534 RepID=UPI0022EB8C24|nr:hypothetical protein [Leucobacter sp. UCMA 4100]MDA3147878.1 hypothetical protein [Leucobacter sp. UCMA 4100]